MSGIEDSNLYFTGQSRACLPLHQLPKNLLFSRTEGIKMLLFKNFEIILLSNNEDQTCHKPCLSKQNKLFIII